VATKNFSKQTAEQVISHIKSYLEADGEDTFNLKIDTFAGVAEVRKARPGKKGDSKKKDRIRSGMSELAPSRRKKVLSAKTREKPKLKHVRNGRMVNLKGYTGF
jgi:hypothetical protein